MSDKKTFDIKIDKIISSCYEEINLVNKEKYNQYYTPISVSNYMSSMFNVKSKITNILDPGCGLGILTIGIVKRLLKKGKVKEINVEMYEIDTLVIPIIDKNMKELKEICNEKKVKLNYIIKNEDFIFSAKNLLLQEDYELYDYVIMNPPYNKMSNDSEHKQELMDIEMDVSNYYTAFVLLSCKLLKNKGELVAITPRSFCNGKYHSKFRNEFLNMMYFDRIHLFESRRDVFNKDDILQETMIYHCIKGKAKKDSTVKISHSNDSVFDNLISTNIPLKELICGDDKIIRLSRGGDDDTIIRNMMKVRCTLEEIGIEVSTGPVVDFREDPELLHRDYINGLQILLFPEHIQNRQINWPKIDGLKKFNYISISKDNEKKLRPNSNYVLVKRMTSKEEDKRIVAALYNGEMYEFDLVGFDNKVNYFHINKQGIDIDIAKGLTIYLNSTLVDSYFRTFSGNTQVNVSDLKMIRYPDIDQLRLLGAKYEDILHSQYIIDNLINDIIL